MADVLDTALALVKGCDPEFGVNGITSVLGVLRDVSIGQAIVILAASVAHYEQLAATAATEEGIEKDIMGEAFMEVFAELVLTFPEAKNAR